MGVDAGSCLTGIILAEGAASGCGGPAGGFACASGAVGPGEGVFVTEGGLDIGAGVDAVRLYGVGGGYIPYGRGEGLSCGSIAFGVC